jgi:hypothetical protein
MPVIARDAVASDHLVYAWPFPIGPDDYEVACAEDELVVMCPAWVVGDRLGPGRHRWRTPDPSRPSSAFFVLTAPVEVSFDMITQFMLPTTHQSVRLRATGSLQVRCMDPALLVAQFVGLPFDSVNEGVLRSVSRSIERMLARLLTRRVVMAGTPQAVTDRQMLSNIIEELIAYNPAAGAVFGIELVRFGHLEIFADDGSRPWLGNGAPQAPQDLLETVRGTPPPPERTEAKTVQQAVVGVPTTNPGGRAKSPTSPGVKHTPPMPLPVVSSGSSAAASGEIVPKTKAEKSTAPGHAAAGHTLQTPVVPPPSAAPASNTVSSSSGATASGTLNPNRPMPSPLPRRAGSVEIPQSVDEITHPGIDMRTPPPGTLQSLPAAGSPLQAVSGEIGGNKSSNAGNAGDGLAQGTPAPKKRGDSEPSPGQESRGSILGIGVAHIGSSGVASGEITKKIAPGGRVLVPGPNGLMQSATVRQLLSGYYELEVGGSGETIWVPVSGVVPE